MRALRIIARFLIQYKLFSFAILAVIAGLALEFTGLHTAAHWTLGTASIISVFPIIGEMWQDFRTGRYGIDILAVTAIVVSVILKQYWAGIVIVVMFTGGEALENFAERRAKTELDALLHARPQRANIIRKGKELAVKVSEIRVGDLVVLKPGDVVPVDAVVIEGTASLDESSLTGEARPQPKSADDELLSGSVDIDGAITVKCIREARDSQYEQIIKLVRSAAASQAPVVRLADRYSVSFTLASFCIALAAWYFGHSAIRFLEVLVVATPCPLLLAAPIAIISGMSRAVKNGIIIKSGAALEQLAGAKSIAFDKTGTLTQGDLSIDTVKVFGSFDRATVLAMAASLEQSSNHVLAAAIVDKAKKSAIKIPKAKNVKETAGQGLESTVSGKSVLVGRLEFLQSHEVELPVKLSEGTEQTAAYVAINGELAGLIGFKDNVRSETKPTIKRLRKIGLQHILMITGDHLEAAQAVAKQLGIKEFYAGALPADKLRVIEQLADRPAVFVGDGVNDAPVLTASDVGIALGTRGSTAATQSADMVIMLDDISRVARAYEIAKRTYTIAKQSILGGIALSIVLMLVFATGKFPPLAGAIIQELVDIIVILNALRAHGSREHRKHLTATQATASAQSA